MRQKGGVSKERIMNDPAFKRTRENGSEFNILAKGSKVFRNAAAILIRKAYDGTLNNRLMHVLAGVKNADLVSVRGERKIGIGLATAAGKVFLKGLDLNGRSSLRSLLAAPYALDTATGKVSIDNLIPAEQLVAPAHATHVSFQSAFMNLDFDTEISEVFYSPVENLPLNVTPVNLALTPTAVPSGAGNSFYLLLIEFYQEVNGVQYALNNGNYNSLTLLDVL
ncbi:hypothetical protein [Flavobacterium sp.]|uniref:hypothetical protein n=1 Tax=Flavobacterium sp. TaxID=239 RepID=UPI00286C4CFA|nr:hypothetical protein [Flavobacterium sp.]